jgi:hypothetical protein
VAAADPGRDGAHRLTCGVGGGTSGGAAGGGAVGRKERTVWL